MKNKLLNVKVSDEFLTELIEVAVKTDTPYSQIVRGAVKDRIAEIKRTHPAFTIENEVVVESVTTA